MMQTPPPLTAESPSDLSREIQDMLNDENCEDLDLLQPHSGATSKPSRSPPTTLQLPNPHQSGIRTSAQSSTQQQQQIRLGDSPTDHVAASLSTDFISSTSAKLRASPSARKPSPAATPSALMTVTSPAWSGTSWTGGLAHGCTAVLKSGSTAATTTSAVPLGSSGGGQSAPTTPGGGNKLESLKNWTISTYKVSRQSIYEKLGKTSRTVDTELEAQIESLRDTQRKYANILRLARALTSHFYHVVQVQSSLGDCFNDLAHKSPELQDEFLYNSETQRNLTKNGQVLISALNFFVSSVNTLCNKTMEDTIATVRQYEMARVEYDAYRSDLEYYATNPQTDVTLQKQRETEEVFTRQKQEFEKLRSDVQIKLKFLDENRVKVMHKQLLLFHNAISAYFSGNQTALEATMKQFSIKVKTPNQSVPSWIEQ